MYEWAEVRADDTVKLQLERGSSILEHRARQAFDVITDVYFTKLLNFLGVKEKYTTVLQKVEALIRIILKKISEEALSEIVLLRGRAAKHESASLISPDLSEVLASVLDPTDKQVQKTPTRTTRRKP